MHVSGVVVVGLVRVYGLLDGVVSWKIRPRRQGMGCRCRVLLLLWQVVTVALVLRGHDVRNINRVSSLVIVVDVGGLVDSGSVGTCS